ncbi:MAG: HDOD domain-containing protein [Betaproteobacteria bacterium]|nr:HDOD domain-containing protein [Betaproteobacteria bacterium]
MHSAQEILAYADRLTTLPDVYLKIRAELDDQNASIPAVSEVIASDPAITASLLKLANSPFYGYARKIESIQRAVTLIGLKHLHELVLAISVNTLFAGIQPRHMDVVHFWRNSVERALLARAVAQQLNGIDPERFFISGLLADSGHLVMCLAVPDLMEEVFETSPQPGENIADVERAIVGCDFAEVGAALTATWRLPLSYGVEIGSQLNPHAAGEHVQPAALLNLVSRVIALQGNESSLAYEYPLHPDSAELAGIDLEAVQAVLKAIQPEFAVTLAAFSQR